MKTSLSILLLLLILLLSSWSVAPASTLWPPDVTVKVYFVRDMFAPEQTEMLWEAMDNWAQSAARRPAFRFVYAGETSGLIDCVGCLTVAREDMRTYASRRGASFNSLRHDEAGQLISAWVGLDLAVTNAQTLRGLMIQTLDRGFGSNDRQTGRNRQRP